MLDIRDRGHGPNTYPPSKGVPQMPEFSFNNAVVSYAAQILGNKIKGEEAQSATALDVPLVTRTNRYNAAFRAAKDAIGSSHHANWNDNPSVRGFGVFYWHNNPKSKRLAEMYLAEYKREFPDLPIWGTGLFASMPGSWTNFHMTRVPNYPAVLVEWGFMSSPQDLRLLMSDDYRRRCGKVAAKVTCAWYGIPFVEGGKVVPIKPAQTIQPVVDKAPPAVGQEVVHLPPAASSWRLYPTNKAPVKGNEMAFLNPAKFGGLSYTIIARPQANVVTIQTSQFGKGNIFVGPGTGATFSSNQTSPAKPLPKKRFVKLPARSGGVNNTSWALYHLNKPPRRSPASNIKLELNPHKFGGLEYEVLGNHSDFVNVVKIKSAQAGEGWIYVGKETGAKFETR
ncbi:N-acetylmuramoyl-L-alanine amidase family protein [Jeotgalibacillus proteolyticus]|uniref:MurNAc-LAA domain-containing protein n=1 Tax=Jeotgalibacillus proteolyticus TaxID=2082395 RepID=A0A2S5GFY2_9BACL|nr:N-acetylmuramoyl-L-alanine amidase [Jeotgalibacillus proteolyticus]PPA71899.1 hypothetical protein C4B60_00525 [Jeotgalibacillus proteolyticus]